MIRIFIVSSFFGACSSLSFSFFFLIPLKIIGFIFYLKNLYLYKDIKKIFYLSVGFGFGYFLVGLHWIIFPLTFDSFFKNFIPFVIILFPLFFSLFFFIASYLYVIFLRNLKIHRTKIFFNSFLITLILFLCEYLRAFIFGGFPWNLHGHIWAFDFRFIQISKYIGVFGLSFLTIFWIVLIANLFMKRSYNSCAIVLLIFPLTLFLFSLNDEKNISNEFIKIRIVQPNIPQEKKWSKIYITENLQKTIDLSFDQINKNSKPEIIIWPEVAIPFIIEENLDFRKILPLSLLKDSLLITGALRKENVNNNLNIFNSLFVLSANGVEDYYDKRKLVPFGEYFPLRRFFNFKKITDGNKDFSPGIENKNIQFTFENKKITFEPSICYEGIFQNNQKFKKESDFIINITNDAWFGTTSGPSQHLTATRFRSVEKGIPLIRVANTGISAIFNEKGKRLISIPLNVEQSETLIINLNKKKTLFSRYGNLCLVILIFLVCLLSNIIDNFLLRKKTEL